jgi:hypothetical protein
MSTRNRILIIALVALWIGWPNQRTQARSSHVCSDACGSGASCDAECWLTQFDFDQDNPSTTCGDQGYSCCGDGWCDSGAEGCNVCPDDCGYVNPDDCGGCNSDEDCSGGEVCNAARQCVTIAPYVAPMDAPACGGSCTNSSTCCGNDVCSGDHGFCGAPDYTYCPLSPSCSSDLDCYRLGDQYCFWGYPDVFCDPGIGRCQFNWGFDCPDANFANVCF